MIRVAEFEGTPVYICEANENIKPSDIKEDFAQIICSDGIYIKKSNFLYSGLFKVEKNCGKVDETITYNSSFRIPSDLFYSVEKFLEEVYKKYSSEGVVILYYNKEVNKWAYCIPEQEVTAASASYEITDKAVYVIEGEYNKSVKSLEGDGWIQCGSIHSHASMDAFHSGVDDKDEFDFDGIHITIGKFNAEKNYSCRFIFSGKEVKMSLSDVISIHKEIPEDILSLVSKKTYEVTQGKFSYWNKETPYSSAYDKYYQKYEDAYKQYQDEDYEYYKKPITKYETKTKYTTNNKNNKNNTVNTAKTYFVKEK